MQSAIEMFEGLYNLRDANKFNIAVGFFQKYSAPAVESDSYGKFYCDIKLHYKDEESNDVSALNVPLFYIGGSNGALFFELVQGDELLVVFSDKTLENWKPSSGTVPQGIGNPVKDSINHAIAIPIISAHKAAEVLAEPVGSDITALRTTPGKTAEIGNGLNKMTVDDDEVNIVLEDGKKFSAGNGTDELVDLVDQFMTETIAAMSELVDLVSSSVLGGGNSVDLGGTASTGALFKIATPLATVESNVGTAKSNMETIQSSLGNIKA